MKLDTAQKRIIRSKVLGYNLVRGTAGSGKTTVAVNRSIFLKDNYCLYETDKILMVAQNDSHLQQIKETLHKTEESQTEFITLFSNQVDKVHLETIDNIVYSYFLEHRRKNKYNCKLIIKEEQYEITKQCLNEIKNSYKGLKVLNERYIEFIIDEINWIKDCNYIKLEEYQKADRVGRKVTKEQGPKRLLKNSKAREAIFNMMQLYNNLLKEKNLVDQRDITLLATKYAEDSKKKYSHIIADDSQDLTKIQLEFLDLLCSKKAYSNIMLIVNREKHLNQNGWITKGRKFASLNLDENIKKYSLNKKYGPSGQLENDFKSIETSQEQLDILNSCGDSKNNINNPAKLNEKYGEKGIIEMSNNTSPFIEKFQYCDLRHSRKYSFTRDLNNISELLVKSGDSEDVYSIEELKQLAVYSDIAAGEPILMNSDIEGDFYIPQHWLKGVKDCFLLKVKGDSMIEADIDDGDYVVIRKQYAAQNNDIVAVDLDGNATLKRLQIGKGRIVLMPENEKYYPIEITDNEINVIGVAVGVVKQKI
ncbi:S24 family peptidase [Clostridium sp. A1-XYC3]|uniref:S24 family peptidase n=1 Tax=Clostridium tanneri TaxID=3037988 RepID=A0ABU4JU14_9CLOT|nr:S24 family peptidase [Clostridium sp. A1-XYC3]MDW8801434.1 S24 family peptidase [Clostridium sp. A1-XYC3]